MDLKQLETEYKDGLDWLRKERHWIPDIFRTLVLLKLKIRRRTIKLRQKQLKISS